MKLSARRTMATAVTLTRALMANAKDAADIDVKASVKKNIKNFEASTVNPVNYSTIKNSIILFTLHTYQP